VADPLAITEAIGVPGRFILGMDFNSLAARLVYFGLQMGPNFPCFEAKRLQMDFANQQVPLQTGLRVHRHYLVGAIAIGLEPNWPIDY